MITEAGRAPGGAARQASVAAVVRNPWAGHGARRTTCPTSNQRIAPVLARLLTDRLIAALGGVDAIEAFGKAAIVGTAGEIEHAGALIHTPYFGNLMREFLEGESIICFADTRADAGETAGRAAVAQDPRGDPQPLPDDLRPRPDAPRADEIVVIAAASTGPGRTPASATALTDPTITTKNLESALS